MLRRRPSVKVWYGLYMRKYHLCITTQTPRRLRQAIKWRLVKERTAYQAQGARRLLECRPLSLAGSCSEDTTLAWRFCADGVEVGGAAGASIDGGRRGASERVEV
jgi:hypothetical protein